jgi:hypothetical protein
MNVKIRTVEFPEKEYINGIFLAVRELSPYTKYAAFICM